MKARLPLIALALAAVSPAAGGRQQAYSETQPSALPAPPMIESVSPTFAFQPGKVTVTGTGLEFIREATVAGVPAEILFTSAEKLVILPPSTDPGFMTLRVAGAVGMGSEARAEMWPSLEATVDDGRMIVRLGNGDDGIYFLAANLEIRTTPYEWTTPPTGYHLWLQDDFVLFSHGIVPTPDPMFMTFPVPPQLAGFELYLQGWCQQRFFGYRTQCFTNLTSVGL